MSGSVAGGKLAAQRNIERYGADYYRNLGKLGGVKGRGHKFAHGKVDAVTAGKKGGRKPGYVMGEVQRAKLSRGITMYWYRRGVLSEEERDRRLKRLQGVLEEV